LCFAPFLSLEVKYFTSYYKPINNISSQKRFQVYFFTALFLFWNIRNFIFPVFLPFFVVISRFFGFNFCVKFHTIFY